MTSTLQARNLAIRDLIDRFGLCCTDRDQFFYEWQESILEITEQEKALLDKLKAGFFNLVMYPPLLEKPVREAIVSPLLFLADLYLPPFHIRAEDSIEVSVEDDQAAISIRGALDILVLKENFWLLVIESKRLGISIEEGLAQILTYLLANPNREQPSFGLLTNGASFLFIKLAWHDGIPTYATSDQFAMRRRGNDLYEVLRILKQITTHFCQ